MRREVVVGLLSFLVCGMFGCSYINDESQQEIDAEINLAIKEEESSEVKPEMDFSQGDLYTMFTEMNDESVQSFLYDDYNKDGMHEAFVVTDKESAYNLWYMSPTECKIVEENLGAVDVQKTEIIGFETKDYLFLQRSLEGVKNTLVYTLDEDNKVVSVNVSGRGYIYQNASSETFIDVAQKKNDGNPAEEPTYTTYYLYHVSETDFREYGAIPIGEEQFLTFEGAQEILDSIHEIYGDKQIEIAYLYRANHYININITVYDDGGVGYENLLLHYDDKKVTYVSQERKNGKVDIAHVLGIATFPTSFKEPETSDE